MKSLREPVYVQTVGRLVLLLALPVAAGTVMWLFAQLAQHRAQWVEHTLRVEISLENLSDDIRTAEDNQRGYLLTGEPRFLDAYRAAERDAREEVSSLATLTADNPRQKQTLAGIQPLLDARFSFLQSLIDAYHLGGLDLPSTKTQMDQHRIAVGSIQDRLDAMRSAEERLLAVREAGLARARTNFSWILFLGYGLMVVVVASLYLSVRRHSLHSAAAEARLSQLNEQLEMRVRERTALLQAREELLDTFVRSVPAAVSMLDRRMHYLQASERWCDEYGIPRSQLLGASHYALYPDIPDRWKDFHRRCLEHGETLRADEDPWIRADGSVIWVRWEIHPWGLADGRPEGMLIFSENITARKQIEENLRQSEATIRTLLETASQAILAVDSAGAILIANRMVGEMFGYAPDELIGRPLENLIPERFRQRHRLYREVFTANPKTRSMGLALDLVGLRNDGCELPIEVSLSSVHTEKGLLAVAFVSDITARKKAEADLRESERTLRSLAASLLTAQEDERRNLARELHDDVTQRLALLSIELGRLAVEWPNSKTGPRPRLEELQQQALRASSEVRRLSHGLHPSVITDFGLSVALEEFCDEFEKGQGIRVRFEGPVEDSRLNDGAATCLYRIAQESLRNAVVHGHATEVRVALQITQNAIQLSVDDNGSGFSNDAIQNRKGLGVVSMMERIRLVNGTLAITSEPAHGCHVLATVPLAGVST